MKGNSVCPGNISKRCRITSVMLILAVMSVLILGLSACDGEATYTPPPPTTVGKDETATANTPSASSVDTPTQAPIDTPTQTHTPLPPPTARPEGYPVPPTPDVATPVAYPEATSSS